MHSASAQMVAVMYVRRSARRAVNKFVATSTVCRFTLIDVLLAELPMCKIECRIEVSEVGPAKPLPACMIYHRPIVRVQF
jgi:hypothetical protein